MFVCMSVNHTFNRLISLHCCLFEKKKENAHENPICFDFQSVCVNVPASVGMRGRVCACNVFILLTLAVNRTRHIWSILLVAEIR